MARATSEEGACSIIHRYNTPEEQAELVDTQERMEQYNIGFAVGVGDDLLWRVCECPAAGATFVCVDVAYGHHIMMKEALQTIRDAIYMTYTSWQEMSQP